LQVAKIPSSSTAAGATASKIDGFAEHIPELSGKRCGKKHADERWERYDARIRSAVLLSL
jgi:hypothetical protein